MRNQFELIIDESNFSLGSFDIPSAFDPFVRDDDGPIEMFLAGGPIIEGQVYRGFDSGGKIRIEGRAPLRDWFQAQFQDMALLEPFAFDGIVQTIMDSEEKNGNT